MFCKKNVNWWLTTICNSSTRGFDPFWPLQALGTKVVHRHACRQKHKTYKIKLNLMLMRFDFKKCYLGQERWFSE